ncbi:MAG: tripartite tricarboxylate transporter TctB family protein [Leptothrix sp. (in: Bacteria)]|nr:tripartite tricarboxylate transporter TctB family protein [Leptothrix sp. (in: b-proteobacteria)]
MSDNTHSEEADSPAVAKNKTVDAIVAVLLLIVGAVVIFEARRLGAEWTSDGPGSGYFPFYIGVILCISALGILYQSTVGKNPDHDTFVDRVQLKRVASVFVPALVYVLAIMFLGIYVASAIYIALFMVLLGEYSPVRSVLLGVAVNAFFFVLFEVWFKVPLFKGSFEPLSFLGY